MVYILEFRVYYLKVGIGVGVNLVFQVVSGVVGGIYYFNYIAWYNSKQ